MIMKKPAIHCWAVLRALTSRVFLANAGPVGRRLQGDFESEPRSETASFELSTSSFLSRMCSCSESAQVRVGTDLSAWPLMPGTGRLYIVLIRSGDVCTVAVGNDKAMCGAGDNMTEAAKAAEYAGAVVVISIAFEAIVTVVTSERYEASYRLDHSRQLNELVLHPRCRVRSSDDRFTRLLGACAEHHSNPRTADVRTSA